MPTTYITRRDYSFIFVCFCILGYVGHVSILHGIKITIEGTCETPPSQKLLRVFTRRSCTRTGRFSYVFFLIGLILFGWAACEPAFGCVFSSTLVDGCSFVGAKLTLNKLVVKQLVP